MQPESIPQRNHPPFSGPFIEPFLAAASPQRQKQPPQFFETVAENDLRGIKLMEGTLFGDEGIILSDYRIMPARYMRRIVCEMSVPVDISERALSR